MLAYNHYFGQLGIIPIHFRNQCNLRLTLSKIKRNCTCFFTSASKKKRNLKETIHGKGAQNIVSKCSAGIAAASEGEEKAF